MFRFVSRMLPRSKKSQPSRRPSLQVENLEDRQLMHAAAGASALLSLLPPEMAPAQEAALIDVAPVNAAAVGPAVAVEGTVLPLIPVVPAHSSLPGAPATLYLDFNGHYQQSWGSYSPGYTRTFDFEGNVYSFNAAEQSAIENIWKRVSEDFAPFNINVTTVDPGDFSNGKALRVVIGGSSSDWIGGGILGVSYLNSFTNSYPNVSYVFAEEFGNNPAGLAKTISHEAGHAFGLEHHIGSVAGRFPLMKQGLVTDANGRTTWYNLAQDDVGVLAGAVNGFGYRADDHGNTFGTATALTTSLFTGSVSGKGIIEKTSDVDVFSFSTSGGMATLTLNVADVGPNLDARIEVWRAGAFAPTAVSDPSGSLGASITTYLTAGNYYLRVKSHGSYGDLGQYTISGNVPKIVVPFLGPLTAVQPFVHPSEPVTLPQVSADLSPQMMASSAAFTPAPFKTVDLKITSVDYVGTKIYVNVANSGPFGSGWCTLQLTLSGWSSPLTFRVDVPPMMGHGTATVMIDTGLNSYAGWLLSFLIDSDNEVAESNEANNYFFRDYRLK